MKWSKQGFSILFLLGLLFFIVIVLFPDSAQQTNTSNDRANLTIEGEHG